jgi:hypothetical protein
MSLTTQDLPERLNPAWQLPAYLEQVRRIHLDLFTDQFDRAHAALDEIGEQPDRPGHDEIHARLALRHPRLGMANYAPPMSSIALRAVRRDTVFKLFYRCEKMVSERLGGWDEATHKVGDLLNNVSLAAILVEMVCLMVERSDLPANPAEKVIDAVSWMIDYAATICGDAEMRERDEDVTIGTKLANIELEELAMSMVLRLSEVHALLEHHQLNAPAAYVRGV